jgi:hypothetical protein
MIKVSIFIDPRINTDEVVQDLSHPKWGFTSIKAKPTSRQPLIEWESEEKDIEEWAGEFNRFSITYEDICYF